MFTTFLVFLLMRRRPPRSTRTDTLFPYTTLFRSTPRHEHLGDRRLAGLPRPHPAAAGTHPLRPVARPALVLRRPRQPRRRVAGNAAPGAFAARELRHRAGQPRPVAAGDRSEERRVGKEGVRTGRSRGSPYH